jgi:transposase
VDRLLIGRRADSRERRGALSWLHLGSDAVAGMGFIEGCDRAQAVLFATRLEECVAAGAAVRVIDAFVAGLDVRGLGFERAEAARTGRPGYQPRDLLGLYIYGYLNEVRSSRRLERECGRNVELMWLLGRLRPDFKTIADFRRDQGKALVAVCRAFVLFCRDQGLFAARLVALDGSKVRAAASSRRIMDAKNIAEQQARIEVGIAAYLEQLDAADAQEPDEADAAATEAALLSLRKRQAELQALAQQLTIEERTTVVDGEPEARQMGIGPSRKPPAYNAQLVVDTETGLIVHHEVTTEATDNRLLYPMARAAKESLGVDSLTVVADAGYSNGTDAAACETDGITPCVPRNRSVNNQGDGMLFDRSMFVYEADEDRYRCPAGEVLLRKTYSQRDHSTTYQARDCTGCALKERCTLAVRRTVTRHEHEDALERMEARVKADPDLMHARWCSAEHPFGTIKRMSGARFLTRGLNKVRTEFALSVLAYNVIRMLNLSAQAA